MPVPVPAASPTLGVDTYMEEAMRLGIAPERAAAVLLLCLIRASHQAIAEHIQQGLADQLLLVSLRDAMSALRG